LNSDGTVQRSEQQQFLYETTVEQLVKDTLQDVVTIHNLRQRVTKLKLEGTELAQYGFAKQPDKQGIDTYSEESIVEGEFYKMDPTGRRNGNGAPHLARLPGHRYSVCAHY
jgi:cilia- and flagella-associated protein 298